MTDDAGLPFSALFENRDPAQDEMRSGPPTGPMCDVPPPPRDPNLPDAAEIVAQVTGPAQ